MSLSPDEKQFGQLKRLKSELYFDATRIGQAGCPVRLHAADNLAAVEWAIEALNAARAQSHTAEGWVLVPVEATPEMLNAGNIDIGCRRDCSLGRLRASDAYRAMLAASPPPPAIGSGWRDIASAPKDGTSIWAYCVHPNYRCAVVAGEDPSRWTEVVLAQWIDHNGGGWTWHGMAGEFRAWMPANKPDKVPAPPSDGGE